MIDKDPTTWPIATWLLAMSMALMGGMVNFISKVKAGKSRLFNVTELLGELFTSGFVGLGVFMLAQSLEQSLGFSAALAGISGHMATRLLFLVENLIEKRLTKESE